jgi:N-acetylmuramoyl-L-alanine amidase
MFKVGLDAGHGYPDDANQGPTGYKESCGTLAIVLAAKKYLERTGTTKVILSRTGTEKHSPNLSERAFILNKHDLDVVVSVHTNAPGKKEDWPKVRGLEIIHSIRPESKGRELGEILYKLIPMELGIPPRKIYSRESENPKTPGQDYYYMIKNTNAPCIIIELEYHTHPDAEAWLKRPENLDKAGLTIAKGILIAGKKWGLLNG